MSAGSCRVCTTGGAICVVHTAQIACRAPRTKTIRKCNILSVRCSPHRWNFERDLCGVHHANAIYVVYTTRMRFTRCTPYTSPKGAIYVVHSTRMRITQCIPHTGPGFSRNIWAGRRRILHYSFLRVSTADTLPVHNLLSGLLGQRCDMRA